MNLLNGQTVLATGALLILGCIGAGMLVFPIPAANAQSVTFILGALAGALTLQTVAKTAASPPAPPANLKEPIT